MTEPRKIEMTRIAFDKMKAELDERSGPRRERIVGDISTARAHGDLSENAEYHAAREEQAQNEAKIRELAYKLEHASIVEASEDGVVGPGMLVTIRHEGDDPETYLLGQRGESDDYDILTPESPIGLAILGRAAGETVAVRIGDRDTKVEIVEVKAL